MTAAAIAALLAAAATPAVHPLPAGRILDAVACRADPSQTYSLYVPSTYTPDRDWPILYCFDPGARGRVPVERFREGAETYGYIVAGSNNSRNGPVEPSIAAAQAIWNDTHERFRIDAHRTYGAGFSGGARLISGIALRSGALAGVVACGAGFPDSLIPKAVPFLFFGAAGIEDFNYFELKEAGRGLDGIATHRVVFFEGGHDWAPAAQATDAIEWFELQAMKLGAAPRDERLIVRLREKRLEKARASEASGLLPDAQAEYASLAADFQGLAAVDDFETAARRLAKSKEVRRAAAEDKEQAAEQERLSEELLRAAEKGDSITLGSAAESLRKQAGRPEDSPARRIARRVIGGAYVHAFYEGRAQLDAKQYARAARWLELQAALRPDRPLVHCELARVYALTGDRKRARKAFARAMHEGFGYFLVLASSRR